jgi:hypothetical protein
MFVARGTHDQAHEECEIARYAWVRPDDVRMGMDKMTTPDKETAQLSRQAAATLIVRVGEQYRRIRNSTAPPIVPAIPNLLTRTVDHGQTELLNPPRH